MFEGFDSHARNIVKMAQEEARSWKHNYTGTEHLLAALTQSVGASGQSLITHGITLDRVRDQIKVIVGYNEDSLVTAAPFTPELKKALELALRRALQIEDKHIGTEHILLDLLKHIGTEHILLGLLRTTEGNHVPILEALFTTPATVRSEIYEGILYRDRTTPVDPEDVNEREEG